MIANRDYIAKDSPENAYNFLERLFESAEQLADFPEMGHQVPEFLREDVRKLLYQDYRIIYRINTPRVEILTVVHGSRNLQMLKFKAWNGNAT